MQRDNLSFYEAAARQDSITIVSVPTELGSDSRGLSRAPEYLLKNGLEKVLTSLGSRVRRRSVTAPAPHGEVAGNAKRLAEVALVARKTAAVVEVSAKKGPVVALGGDHSMAIGSIAGASRVVRSLGVIWIDAHPDCNTPETTLTGNLHGQVTSALMGDGAPELVALTGGRIQAQQMLYIGLKDLDAAEISYLREKKAKTVTVLDIAGRGLFKAMNAIDALSRQVDAVWVSMDMDSIDEKDAPGVGLRNTAGLTKREALSLAQYIGKTCRVAGMDLVEVSPEKDIDGKTARLALELTARFFGGEYSWYKDEYMDGYVGNTAAEKKEA